MARKKLRDSQRSRVYKAQHHLGQGQRFYSIKGVQTYVNKFINSKWWQNRFDIEFVKVYVIKRKTQWAYCMVPIDKVGALYLPKDMFNEIVVLHELAHLITPDNTPHHGDIFTGNFLHLVRKKMGVKKYNQLKHQFEQHKVKWTD